jgi:hypothetical protein
MGASIYINGAKPEGATLERELKILTGFYMEVAGDAMAPNFYRIKSAFLKYKSGRYKSIATARMTCYPVFHFPEMEKAGSHRPF